MLFVAGHPGKVSRLFLCLFGARRYSPPATLDMGPGLPPLRAVFFADPDGTTLELIEPPADAGS